MVSIAITVSHTHTPSPVSPSYWKDAVLVLSITLSLLGVLYALRQRHSAQSRIDTFLESIRVYERELSELKERSVQHPGMRKYIIIICFQC